MSYRIVAQNSGASTGVAKPTAVEALQAVRQLHGEGFYLKAIINDDGDAVPVEHLAELAEIEDQGSY